MGRTPPLLRAKIGASRVIAVVRIGVVALAVAIGLSACRNAMEPADRAPLDPPAEYLAWWDATRTCAGLPDAHFGRVRWWTATDVLTEEKMSGLWVAEHDIYLRPDKVDAEIVIRHEMVHDLLQRGDHESPYFEECVGRKRDGGEEPLTR